MESRSAKTQRHVRSAVLTQSRSFGLAAEEAAWAVVVIPELSCAKVSFHVSAAGALAVGIEVAIPSAWLMLSKQGVILLSSLLSHGRVVGASFECALNRICVGYRLAVNSEAVHLTKVTLDTFSLVTVEGTPGYFGQPWNEMVDTAAKRYAQCVLQILGDQEGSIVDAQLEVSCGIQR